MLALSEAQRRANDKYIKENYRQVKLSTLNEKAEKLEAYCKKGLFKIGIYYIDHEGKNGA